MSEWVKDNGSYYYYYSDGTMATGWQQLDGDWYYFYNDGSMTWSNEVDGYYLGSDGRMVTDERWVNTEEDNSGTWYYVGSDEKVVTGWNKIGDDFHYFNHPGGSMTWDNTIDGFYLDNDGKMVSGTGWLKDEYSGDWYYFSDGQMTTGWVQDGDNWYYLNDDGKMATGWENIDGDWYYFYSDGEMATGWVNDGSGWYFLDNNGSMKSNDTEDGYHLNSSGKMVTGTGWKYVDSWWYYLDDTGKVVTGWLEDGDNWYYLYGDNGSMAKDTTIDGYYLNDNGEWVPNEEDSSNSAERIDNMDYSDLYVNGYYDREAAVQYATNPDYSSPDQNDPMFSDYIEEKLSAVDFRKHTRKYNYTEYERYDDYDYYAEGHMSGSDCANFISQVIKAGGVKETDGWNFKWENDYGPYGTDSRTPIATTSWIRPKEQLEYLQSNGYINGDLITINSIGDMKNAVENDGIQVGDLMFLENEKEGIHHSTVITQISDDGIIYYSAHSNDRINYELTEEALEEETAIIAKMKN